VQGADVLLTIAEIAVAFAGFASIVVLFQHRDPGRWPAAVVVRLRTMIEGSLVTLFSALLPIVLHHLGLSGGTLWSVCSVALALGYAVFGGLVWRRSRAALAGGQLSPAFSAAVAGVTVALGAGLLLNAADLVFHRTFGAYLAGVAWALVFASLMFLRLAAFPIGASGSE
jgi:hypothetical protein